MVIAIYESIRLWKTGDANLRHQSESDADLFNFLNNLNYREAGCLHSQLDQELVQMDGDETLDLPPTYEEASLQPANQQTEGPTLPPKRVREIIPKPENPENRAGLQIGTHVESHGEESGESSSEETQLLNGRNRDSTITDTITTL